MTLGKKGASKTGAVKESRPKGRGFKKGMPRELPTAAQLQAELEYEVYKNSYIRILRSTIGILAVVVAISILIAEFLVPVLRIYGSGMDPALSDGQIVLASKHSEFKTGDVVAFYFNNKILVKRVVAGPGDVVNIDPDGTVYVNDMPKTESYVDVKTYGDVTVMLPLTVPEERYFLLGDQRELSVDSRSSAIGCVSQEQIVGKIIFRVWPLTKIGAVK